MDSRSARSRFAGTGGVLGALLFASGACAQGAAEETQRLDALRKQLDDQTSRLEALKRDLAAQESKIAEMKRQMGIEKPRSTASKTASSGSATSGGTPVAAASQGSGSAQSQGEYLAQAQQPQPVGQAPAQKESKPQIAPIFEQPGVLTPRGKFVLDPSLQYSYSSSNRVALVGYTIIPALLIGLIDVREVKRNTFTASLTGRYGVTNRFELEARVPYVYRNDDTVSREFGTGTAVETAFNATGRGIGDAEVTGRYQLNEGGVDKPYFVGGLRFKSRTGKDPFESEQINTVGARTGLQTELPTGSGFYTLQPSLTMLYPSDPAVLFGSLSYQHNFKRTGVKQKTDVGDIDIGTVEPGGVLGFNIGMGLAINDRTSFSLGYDHQSVGKTKVNGAYPTTAVRVQLGTLLLGYSYRLDEKRTLNLSLGAGLTRDTPDLSLTLRMPYTF